MIFEQDHIHLRCQDLEAAVNYYVDLFGGRVTGRAEVRGMPIVRVRVGQTDLALSPPREGLQVEPDGDRAHYGIYQLGFKVTDLQAALDELAAKGAKIKGQPFEVRPGLKAAFVEALDGVEIELLEYA
jgi:lactoylglutathione lyase